MHNSKFAKIQQFNTTKSTDTQPCAQFDGLMNMSINVQTKTTCTEKRLRLLRDTIRDNICNTETRRPSCFVGNLILVEPVSMTKREAVFGYKNNPPAEYLSAMRLA